MLSITSLTAGYGKLMILHDVALTVAAGNDIRLTAGEAAMGLDEAHQHTSKGSFSRTARTTRDTLEHAIDASFA